jgi:hypothetical protein
MPEMLAQRLYMKAIERIISLEEGAKKLEAELHLLKTSGIAEVAVHNPSVMEYIKHWEGRAEAAEAKLAKAVEAIKQLFALLDITEQTDDGRTFHPNTIRSSRALDAEKLEQVLRKLKKWV